MPGLDTFLAGLGLGGQGLQTLFDPSLNEALSPASGLTVSPYYFQSIEQEGRWKHQLWGFSEGRNLVPPEFGMPLDGPPPPDWPDNPASKIYAGLNAWNKLGDTNIFQINADPIVMCRRQNLFRVQIGALKSSSEAAQKLIVAAGTAASPLIAKLISDSVLADCSFTIGATWLTTQTEILAGYVGLFSAKGFESLFGHRAKVDIGGVPLGNYIPTAQLIGITGYLNPVGPKYLEFRCAVVITSNPAAADVTPVYGRWWTRDGTEKDRDMRTKDSLWAITMNDPLSDPV